MIEIDITEDELLSLIKGNDIINLNCGNNCCIVFSDVLIDSIIMLVYKTIYTQLCIRGYEPWTKVELLMWIALEKFDKYKTFEEVIWAFIEHCNRIVSEQLIINIMEDYAHSKV